MPGRLFLCATPIGNLADASPRLTETLGTVDVVYAEDTRRSSRLLAALGVSADLRSYFVGNERERTAELEADLAAGRDVAVVTDAGAPAVSDPGTAAVAAARRVAARVIVVPGPSAVTAAVSGSGLVEGPFVFQGFLVRRGGERTRQLQEIAASDKPTVLFLSPHRAVADLADLAAACGEEREVCVGRELTKLHEELWWGTLGSALKRWRDEPARGEFTLVIAPGPVRTPSLPEALERARRLMEEGASPSQAAREAARVTGVSRRTIYDGLIK